MERVLIAARGVVACRLIAHFRREGVETVSVFSEPDVEGLWVEEADYQAYLRGHTVEETYLDPSRIVEAAMDSGCEAIHPGTNFLATRPELADVAVTANVPILGVDPQALLRATDRARVRDAAGKAGLPLVPASGVLEAGDDGVAAGALLGFPLYAVAVAAGLARRVSDASELAEAVAAVRSWAGKLEGDERVYLEREVGAHRLIGTLVLVDHAGTIATLGHSDGTLRDGRFSWLEELGPEVVSHDLSARLHRGATELARRVDFVGIGRVSWMLMPDGAWYFLGFSPRLPTGFSLYEQVFGVDLIETQLRLGEGQPLGWDDVPTVADRFGIQARLLFADPRTGRRDPETLERFEFPEDANVEVGVAEGFECTPHTDPLLGLVTALAQTRQAAVVRLSDALTRAVVEGVHTNLQELVQLLGERDYWLHHVDSQTLVTRLGR